MRDGEFGLRVLLLHGAKRPQRALDVVEGLQNAIVQEDRAKVASWPIREPRAVDDVHDAPGVNAEPGKYVDEKA